MVYQSKAFTLVTGASSGIGAACAEVAAELGRPLILTARRLEMVETVADNITNKLGDQTPRIECRRVDVQNPADVDKLFAEVRANQWKIDTLINNAGLALEKKNLEEYTEEELLTMVNTNVTGFLRMLIRTLPFLQETQGYVIGMGSIAGSHAYGQGVIYCATKAAVHMAMEAARIENLPWGVRFTTVAPGAVAETGFSRVRFNGDEAKVAATYAGIQPLTPQDIAREVKKLLQLPANTVIDYLKIMPRAQAGVQFHRGPLLNR
jgi:3-hydroxy acid dehydrogenase/malonic semialdehyde reductase